MPPCMRGAPLAESSRIQSRAATSSKARSSGTNGPPARPVPSYTQPVDGDGQGQRYRDPASEVEMLL